MITQIFKPYWVWECFENGMYEKICFMDQERLIHECAYTLKTECVFEEAGLFVINNWVNSSAHFLSNVKRNRQAYIGQAACSWLHGAPEYITKIAWSRLSQQEQYEANKVADGIIEIWEKRFTSEPMF